MKHKEQRFPIFSDRLRQLQGEMSNTEFAAYLGMSRQTVGFYLNGDRVPDALGLRQIAERCQVSSDWLIGLTTAKEPDAMIQAINSYTGLSSTAIEYLNKKRDLHPHIDVCNFLIEDSSFLVYISNYLSSFLVDSLNKAPYKYIPRLPGAFPDRMKDIFFSSVIQHLPSMYESFKKKKENDKAFAKYALYTALAKCVDMYRCKEITGDLYNFDVDDSFFESEDYRQYINETQHYYDSEASEIERKELELEARLEQEAVREFLEFLESTGK